MEISNENYEQFSMEKVERLLNVPEFLKQEIGLLKNENDKGRYLNVKRFNQIINYNGGMTTHYKSNRFYREQELNNILGKCIPVDSFIVDEGNNNIQIQEITNNATINVYSYFTHKKITMFAPTPERITAIYEAVGEVPPENIIIKSEENIKKGYNEIFPF